MNNNEIRVKVNEYLYKILTRTNILKSVKN